MALLQISEPGTSSAPHEHRLAVGIDLGTTNSLVATVRSGVADTLPDLQGRHMLPSVVRYGVDGSVEVGAQAVEHAVADPHNTIASVKRLMGRGLADLTKVQSLDGIKLSQDKGAVPRVVTAAGYKSAIEISSEILKTLKQRAEQSLGGELAGCVVTVPAYFDDAQRQATKDAARLAGLNVLRLLNEPTAAAIAYGLDRKAEGVIVVYDLGGGTFDVSVLRLRKGVFEVLATGGDTALGGDDFDRAIAYWCMEQLQRDPATSEATYLRSLMQKARDAKETLSKEERTVIHIDGQSLVLTRDDLDRLLDPLVKKTIRACRRVIRDAGIELSEVNDVVMVGGSTRVPCVRAQVEKYFKIVPLIDIDPDRVVAIGAAFQANLLAGNNPKDDLLLLDVIPLSLGLETMGELVEKIIERNTTIPVTRAQEFTTYKDGQTAMRLHVVQGEREIVSDCRSLAKFDLTGLPPLVAGAPRIRVTFQVDADGLLQVSAEELTTGVSASIEVKPSYGLTDQEIESMLRDSIEHAEDDAAQRILREQQVEADRVIEALDAALAKDGDQILTPLERSQIDLKRAALVEVRATSEDPDTIKRIIKELEKACEDYVARRMNAGVRSAMVGHEVKEFNA